MSTDFSYNNSLIITTGPVRSKDRNVPMNARYRVGTYADIATIPVPAVGELVFVLSDENNDNKQNIYVIKSLKASNLGVADSLVDEVVPLKTFLGTEDINLSDYVTETELNDKGYATVSEVDQKIASAVTGGTVDLSGYALKTEVPTKVSQLENDNGFVTETYVGDAMLDALDGHTFKFLTQAEYDSLSDSEKINESIVYNITDSVQDSYSLSYENNTLSLNNNDTPISSVTIENSSRINDYKGCVYNAIGDSITAENRYTSKNYHQYVKDNLELLVVNNYGVDESTITKETSDDTTAMCVRYSNMADADIITVAGGVNDMGLNREIGTIDNLNDEDGLTFYSALRILIEGLINKYPNKLIIFITPANIGDNTFFSEPNLQGKYVRDYANAIKEVCEIYGIPVFDNNTTSGVYPKINIPRKVRIVTINSNEFFSKEGEIHYGRKNCYRFRSKNSNWKFWRILKGF